MKFERTEDGQLTLILTADEAQKLEDIANIVEDFSAEDGAQTSGGFLTEAHFEFAGRLFWGMPSFPN